MAEYKLVHARTTMEFERMVNEAMAAGYTLHGSPTCRNGVYSQAVGKGMGGSDGGSTPGGSMDNGVGFFNYQNAGALQNIQAGEWATLANDGAGIYTESAYAPKDVSAMLDPATGRVLLSDLAEGDQVYMRLTISVTPYTTGSSVLFRALFGQDGQQYEVPFGPFITPPGGAGANTGLFAVDTQFYVRDLNTRMGGLLPQIKCSARADIEFSAMYISVTRRTK